MHIFIPQNIKFLCEYENLKQDEFGEIFGLKRGVIGTYERGRSFPKMETIIQIAEHFNLTLDALVRRRLTEKDMTGGEVTIKDNSSLNTEKIYERLLAEKDKHIDLQNKYVAKLEEEIEELKQQKKSAGFTSDTVKHPR